MTEKLVNAKSISSKIFISIMKRKQKIHKNETASRKDRLAGENETFSVEKFTIRGKKTV